MQVTNIHIIGHMKANLCKQSWLIDRRDHFAFHLFIDLTVAGKGPATWSVTTEFADERLVFELLVNIADEGATSHVAACNLVDWTYLLLTREGVADNNITSHPSASEYLFDSIIILLITRWQD